MDYFCKFANQISLSRPEIQRPRTVLKNKRGKLAIIIGEHVLRHTTFAKTKGKLIQPGGPARKAPRFIIPLFQLREPPTQMPPATKPHRLTTPQYNFNILGHKLLRLPMGTPTLTPPAITRISTTTRAIINLHDTNQTSNGLVADRKMITLQTHLKTFIAPH
ncbi:Multiple epidermal growth factor-like domains protein 9 [Folsomia candida]|uniref:Multiple epidermal growth factor-like domains protein 9 n=1 Tax=Folsomia candida TaxID=158441 RepID=A0A226EFA0_FOLCA|nr:Multiple epidermal growth factor-like domains protein 9 [Folsomia candida]